MPGAGAQGDGDSGGGGAGAAGPITTLYGLTLGLEAGEYYGPNDLEVRDKHAGENASLHYIYQQAQLSSHLQ